MPPAPKNKPRLHGHEKARAERDEEIANALDFIDTLVPGVTRNGKALRRRLKMLVRFTAKLPTEE